MLGLKVGNASGLALDLCITKQAECQVYEGARVLLPVLAAVPVRIPCQRVPYLAPLPQAQLTMLRAPPTRPARPASTTLCSAEEPPSTPIMRDATDTCSHVTDSLHSAGELLKRQALHGRTQ